ncbi:peptidoglycan D,D-transpeptidase FtsI family protein [Risungbinella massiliensis]|uniref:peptidoglycan D,D-transpeptidase FtsI family protein n=1 Tax=Risungbinella massiliensis TaxID=1329796 RepID=UPI00069B47E1|nr:penicillin-binding transpeptidase domain-containing protein [Risungbinella massiliensis]
MGSSLRKSKERSLWIGLLFTVGFCMILCRLLYLQTFESDKLLAEAEKIWKNHDILTAKRGTIYDRNGQPLVWEERAYYFMADPRNIGDVRKTAETLAPVLEIPVETLVEKLSQKKESIPLKDAGKYKYPRSVFEEILSLKDQGKLKGIYGYETTQRRYNSPEAAHVLGFLNSEGNPVGGIESFYQKELKGQDGEAKYKKTKDGVMISDEPETYKAPIQGQDLVLTIDAGIQHQVETTLEEAMKKYQAKGGTAIVSDPYTGEILAMANRPTFDPNQVSSTYDPEKNGRNMAVESQFEPGSTFKIVTLAAAIEEGLFHADEIFNSGSIQVEDRIIRDWKRDGWGPITYRRGVELSSNVAFVKLGHRLGAERLIEYIDRFGFGNITDRLGRRTGIDLPAESKGYFFNRNLYPSELATVSFGQGISVTPIQQVSAVSAIANGGYWVKPHFLKEVKDNEKKKVISTTKIEKRQIIRPETATQVRDILRGVVQNGTGMDANLTGYQVSGKTGTAQKPKPEGGYYEDKYIVSFIGFAPTDKPNVVVYVALDEPIMDGTEGSISAAVARDILKQTLEYRRVPPENQTANNK